jgi:UDP-GlcNAc:undecaprenyl-phosphate/decaprenyl-phosphate GlcNAc-1-phosphate transferase
VPFSAHLDALVDAAAFGLALGISALLTPLVARWATSTGIVAAPRKDRWHSKPTPLLGGVAIYVAATLVILGFEDLDRRLLGLVAGGTLLFITGLIDDRRHLRPHTKLIVQILAACILIVSGVVVETSNLTIIAIPLTILWVVGLTNAFNLLDNMDGLSSGTAVIACGFLFAFSLSVGNVGSAVLSLAVGGASLGFLIYNFNPARIFMGDSGSMFLGFTLSGIALLGTRAMASDIFFVMLVPVAMMGLPIFDTTLVTILRTLEGRPLSQGGRDHLSHRLVALGLSERQAVLVLYLLAASFGSLGLIARSVGVWASLVAACGLVLVAVLLGAYLAQVRIIGPAQYARAARSDALHNRPVVNGMILFKRELGMAAFDVVLVCVAYVGAYVVKYGIPGAGGNAATFEPLPAVFTATLPFVLLVKLSFLLAFQAYRGMWRYMGVADLMLLGRVTVCSSVVLVLILPFVSHGLVVPKSVLIIDWLVFSAVLVGSRASFAALTDTFAHLQHTRAPHLLIVGAGDMGELVLRSLFRSRPNAYQAVGFLDGDAAKWHRSIHGVRVLGGTELLESVALERDVDLVVLALPAAERAETTSLRQRCTELQLPTVAAAAFMEAHFSGDPPPPAEIAAPPGNAAIELG